MEFNFNKELVLKENRDVLAKIKTIPQESLLLISKQTAKKLIDKEKIYAELKPLLKWMKSELPVTGETLKGHFVIQHNGVQQIWKEIVLAYPQYFANEPLYSNVFEYLDSLLNQLDFDQLFDAEIRDTNTLLLSCEA